MEPWQAAGYDNPEDWAEAGWPAPPDPRTGKPWEGWQMWRMMAGRHPDGRKMDDEDWKSPYTQHIFTFLKARRLYDNPLWDWYTRMQAQYPDYPVPGVNVQDLLRQAFPDWYEAEGAPGAAGAAPPAEVPAAEAPPTPEVSPELQTWLGWARRGRAPGLPTVRTPEEEDEARRAAMREWVSVLPHDVRKDLEKQRAAAEVPTVLPPEEPVKPTPEVPIATARPPVMGLVTPPTEEQLKAGKVLWRVVTAPVKAFFAAWAQPSHWLEYAHGKTNLPPTGEVPERWKDAEKTVGEYALGNWLAEQDDETRSKVIDSIARISWSTPQSRLKAAKRLIDPAEYAKWARYISPAEAEQWERRMGPGLDRLNMGALVEIKPGAPLAEGFTVTEPWDPDVVTKILRQEEDLWREFIARSLFDPTLLLHVPEVKAGVRAVPAWARRLVSRKATFPDTPAGRARAVYQYYDDMGKTPPLEVEAFLKTEKGKLRPKWYADAIKQFIDERIKPLGMWVKERKAAKDAPAIIRALPDAGGDFTDFMRKVAKADEVVTQSYALTYPRAGTSDPNFIQIIGRVMAGGLNPQQIREMQALRYEAESYRMIGNLDEAAAKLAALEKIAKEGLPLKGRLKLMRDLLKTKKGSMALTRDTPRTLADKKADNFIRVLTWMFEDKESGIDRAVDALTLKKDIKLLVEEFPFLDSISGKDAYQIAQHIRDDSLGNLVYATGIPSQNREGGWVALHEAARRIASAHFYPSPRPDPWQRMMRAFYGGIGKEFGPTEIKLPWPGAARVFLSRPAYAIQNFFSNWVNIFGRRGAVRPRTDRDSLNWIARLTNDPAINPPGFARSITSAGEVAVRPEPTLIGRKFTYMPPKVAPRQPPSPEALAKLGETTRKGIGLRRIGRAALDFTPLGEGWINLSKWAERNASMADYRNMVETIKGEIGRPGQGWFPTLSEQIEPNPEVRAAIEEIIAGSWNWPEIMNGVAQLYGYEPIEGAPRYVSTERIRKLGPESHEVADDLMEALAMSPSKPSFHKRFRLIKDGIKKYVAEWDDLEPELIDVDLPKAPLEGVSLEELSRLSAYTGVTERNQQHFTRARHILVDLAKKSGLPLDQAHDIASLASDKAWTAYSAYGPEAARIYDYYGTVAKPLYGGEIWPIYQAKIKELAAKSHEAFDKVIYNAAVRLGGDAETVKEELNLVPWGGLPQDLGERKIRDLQDDVINTAYTMQAMELPLAPEGVETPDLETVRGIQEWVRDKGVAAQSWLEYMREALEEKEQVEAVEKIARTPAEEVQKLRRASWTEGTGRRIELMEQKIARLLEEIATSPVEARDLEHLTERSEDLFGMTVELEELRNRMKGLPTQKEVFRFWDYKERAFRKVKDPYGKMTDFKYSGRVQEIANQVYGFEQSEKGAEKYGDLIRERMEVSNKIANLEAVIWEEPAVIVPETVEGLVRFIEESESQLEQMMLYDREPHLFESALQAYEQAVDALSKIRAGEDMPESVASQVRSKKAEIARLEAEREAIRLETLQKSLIPMSLEENISLAQDLQAFNRQWVAKGIVKRNRLGQAKIFDLMEELREKGLLKRKTRGPRKKPPKGEDKITYQHYYYTLTEEGADAIKGISVVRAEDIKAPPPAAPGSEVEEIPDLVAQATEELKRYWNWPDDYIARLNGEEIIEASVNQLRHYDQPPYAYLDRFNTKESLIAKAVEEFGLTEDLNEAGYILEDGSLLDFSGKKEGGPAGERQVDHRAVTRVIGDEWPELGGSHALGYFEIRANALRIMVPRGRNETLIFTLMKGQEITEAQRRVLRKIVGRRPEAIYVEMYDDYNQRIGTETVEMPRVSDVDRVIDKMFKEAKKPRGRTAEGIQKELAQTRAYLEEKMGYFEADEIAAVENQIAFLEGELAARQPPAEPAGVPGVEAAPPVTAAEQVALFGAPEDVGMPKPEVPKPQLPGLEAGELFGGGEIPMEVPPEALERLPELPMEIEGLTPEEAEKMAMEKGAYKLPGVEELPYGETVSFESIDVFQAWAKEQGFIVDTRDRLRLTAPTGIYKAAIEGQAPQRIGTYWEKEAGKIEVDIYAKPPEERVAEAVEAAAFSKENPPEKGAAVRVTPEHLQARRERRERLGWPESSEMESRLRESTGEVRLLFGDGMAKVRYGEEDVDLPVEGLMPAEAIAPEPVAPELPKPAEVLREKGALPAYEPPERRPEVAPGVPAMMTNAMREALKELGYSPAAIMQITPEQAHAFIEKAVGPREVPGGPLAEEPVMPPSPKEAAQLKRDMLLERIDEWEKDALKTYDDDVIKPDKTGFGAMSEHLEEIYKPLWGQLKTYMDKMGEAATDWSLYSYRKCNFDTLLYRGFFWPYWQTRTGHRWLKHFMENPYLLAMWSRWHETHRKINADLPENFQDTVRIPDMVPIYGGDYFNPYFFTDPVYRWAWSLEHFVPTWKREGLATALVTAMPISPLLGVREWVEPMETEEGRRVEPITPWTRTLYESTGINLEASALKAAETAYSEIKPSVYAGLERGKPGLGERLLGGPEVVPWIPEGRYMPTYMNRVLIDMWLAKEITKEELESAQAERSGAIWKQAEAEVRRGRGLTEFSSILIGLRARKMYPSEIEIEEFKRMRGILRTMAEGPEKREYRDEIYERFPFARQWDVRYDSAETAQMEVATAEAWRALENLAVMQEAELIGAIRSQPGNLALEREVKDAQFKETSQLKAHWHRQGISFFFNPRTRTDQEVEDFIKGQILGMIYPHLPEAGNYKDEEGAIDWEAYNEAREAFWKGLPEEIVGWSAVEQIAELSRDALGPPDKPTWGAPRGKRFNVLALAQAIDEEAYDEWKKANDIPVEALNYTWRKYVIDAANEYYQMVKKDLDYEERDMPGFFAQFGQKDAETLIPYILAEYPARWTEEELTEELAGLRLPGIWERWNQDNDERSIAISLLWAFHSGQTKLGKRRFKELVNSSIFNQYFLDKESRNYERITNDELKSWLVGPDDAWVIPDPWEDRDSALRVLYYWSVDPEGDPLLYQPIEEEEPEAVGLPGKATLPETTTTSTPTEEELYKDSKYAPGFPVTPMTLESMQPGWPSLPDQGRDYGGAWEAEQAMRRGAIAQGIDPRAVKAGHPPTQQFLTPQQLEQGAKQLPTWPGDLLSPVETEGFRKWAFQEAGITSEAQKELERIVLRVNRSVGGGGGWAPWSQSIHLGAPSLMAIVHEYAHAYWDPRREEQGDALIEAFTRLVEEKDPQYRMAMNLARDYFFGLTFQGMKLERVDWGKGSGPLKEWNDWEIFAGLASGSRGDLSQLPPYMRTFYEGLFTGKVGAREADIWPAMAVKPTPRTGLPEDELARMWEDYQNPEYPIAGLVFAWAQGQAGSPEETRAAWEKIPEEQRYAALEWFFDKLWPSVETRPEVFGTELKLWQNVKDFLDSIGITDVRKQAAPEARGGRPPGKASPMPFKPPEEPPVAMPLRPPEEPPVPGEKVPPPPELPRTPPQLAGTTESDEYRQALKEMEQWVAGGKEGDWTPAMEKWFGKDTPSSFFWEFYWGQVPPGPFGEEVRKDPIIEMILNKAFRTVYDVKEGVYEEALTTLQAWREAHPEVPGDPEEWAIVRQITSKYWELKNAGATNEATALWRYFASLLERYYPSRRPTTKKRYRRRGGGRRRKRKWSKWRGWRRWPSIRYYARR